ncbi:hypothetical protein [Variovorax fucosicus]|uniref:hypothetical protein n=1 Tax=Variovorax fucosicus TaxID=3053517 RepID=UPI002575FA5F|nr:hypothetical protein [Variovorax sp. J22G47]MDM0058961.1 hypothetical protein [Variovorax sp. J22G47]
MSVTPPGELQPLAGNLHLLYPYVVPKSWVNYIGADSLLTWDFSDDVRMVLVIDGQGMVRNAKSQDLSEAGLSVEEAFEVAASNLGKAFQVGEFQLGGATLIDGTRIGMARGNWMAPAGALMLGNFYEMLRENLGHDEFAAVAVNQQCLFAFPTDEKTLASKSLRIAIEDEFRGHNKPISRTWLKLDGTWPSEHPLNGIFDLQQAN